MPSPAPDLIDRLAEQSSAAHALDLERYLPFLIVATGTRLSASASRAYLDRFGIGVSAWRVLANLKVEPRHDRQCDLRHRGLDKGPVSRAVAGLFESGHVMAGERGTDAAPAPSHPQGPRAA